MQIISVALRTAVIAAVVVSALPFTSIPVVAEEIYKGQMALVDYQKKGRTASISCQKERAINLRVAESKLIFTNNGEDFAVDLAKDRSFVIDDRRVTKSYKAGKVSKFELTGKLDGNTATGSYSSLGDALTCIYSFAIQRQE